MARRTGYFTAMYLIFFTLHAMWDNNYEFIFYSAIMLALLLFITRIYRRIQLADWIMVSLSAFGLLHLAGGNLTVAGAKLYEIEFSGRLHFDNLVHTLGIFLATLIVYNLIQPFADKKIKDTSLVFYFLLVLMALGLGALNEIIEFTAVVFLDASRSVGDYYNNALDNVFNTIGALVAVAVIHQYRRRKGYFDRS